MFYFIKAGQPRIWFSSTGQLLHWESPGTSRARELADVYRLLDCEEDLEGNDRMPALEALKNMVIGFVNLWAVHHMLSRKTHSKFSRFFVTNVIVLKKKTRNSEFEIVYLLLLKNMWWILFIFYSAHSIRPLPVDQRNHGSSQKRRATGGQGGPYFEFVWTEATHPNSIYATYSNPGTQSGNNSVRKSTSGSGIAFRQTQGVQTWRSKHRILSQLQKLLA